jgi:hypothetical protein
MVASSPSPAPPASPQYDRPRLLLERLRPADLWARSPTAVKADAGVPIVAVGLHAQVRAEVVAHYVGCCLHAGRVSAAGDCVMAGCPASEIPVFHRSWCSATGVSVTARATPKTDSEGSCTPLRPYPNPGLRGGEAHSRRLGSGRKRPASSPCKRARHWRRSRCAHPDRAPLSIDLGRAATPPTLCRLGCKVGPRSDLITCETPCDTARMLRHPCWPRRGSSSSARLQSRSCPSEGAGRDGRCNFWSGLGAFTAPART